MIKLIVRADDFGMCESTSLGVLKAYRDGIVTSTSVMINMPGSEQAAVLLKNYPLLCIGLHVNVVIGKPSAELSLIPSLVDEHGQFISSKQRREIIHEGKDPLTNAHECTLEVEAQINRFLNLFGHYPDYLDTHAIQSETLDKVMSSLAEKYHISFLGYYGGKSRNVTHTPYKVRNIYHYYETHQDPRKLFTYLNDELLGKDYALVVLHPGYLSEFVFEHSSLIRERVLDIEALTSQETQKWVKDAGIALISHRDLKTE